MSRRHQRYWVHSDPEQPTDVAHPASDVPHPPCPGICNRDWRKAEHEHPNDHTVAVVHGDPYWCPDCTTRIRRSLINLPEAFVQLELDKLNGKPNPADRGAGKTQVASAPSSPSSCADAQDALVRWLVDWEITVRALLRLSPRRPVLPPAAEPVRRVFVTSTTGVIVSVIGPWPPRPRTIIVLAARRESVTVAATVKFLTVHLGGILTDDRVAIDFGRQVIVEATQLRRRTRLNEQKVRKPVPCPRCNLKTLVHEGGEKYVTCENPVGPCGRLLSMDEYDDLAASWARGASRDGRVSA